MDAVVFDAVGTLFYADPPVAAVYAAAGRRFGSRLDDARIAQRFRTAFARQELLDASQHAGRTSEPRERERWRSIVAEIFDDVNDGHALFETLWRHFAQPANWRLYHDVAGAWRHLRSRGLSVGIASNFDGRLEPLVRGQALFSDCRGVFISSRMGCRKPGSEFFLAVARQLQVPPARLLVVGDDLQNDYRGAQASGCQALLLDRHADSPMPGAIQSLDQLACALDSGPPGSLPA